MEQGENFSYRNGRLVGITVVRLGIGTVRPTEVAPKVGLWETIGMTTKPPRVGDSVTIRGFPVIYVVTVNTEKNTADVKATRDATRDVILLKF
jgi:hypothetical protein